MKAVMPTMAVIRIMLRRAGQGFGQDCWVPQG
jgi:hypothetical protein